ncbi:FAD-dependent oxidoreductase [Actinomadura kijaniata]|uniref:FAD-dependent oxidoreductase n=1 Tax=Actinomadura kijaniata TaxID=46161 RepID=UPI000834104E|nr:NAD(P)/FAD-dependent oxidoreductase [Actinomadura kijaniata]
MSSTPRIAIVGAGPGGLVCARVLQRHRIPVTVFEREADLAARSQGGSLDIRADTGQPALRAAGLFEEFLALARPEGQETRLMDRDATLLHHHLPQPGDVAAPEIDRGRLRALLLDSLAPGTVRWGQAARAAAPLPDGGARLELADGTVEDFDLVVGADGAWSRIRPAVSDARPVHGGIDFVEIHFADADERHPAIADLVGNGSMFANAGRKSLIAQRDGDGGIRVYAAFRGPLDWNADLDLDDTDAVRARLLDIYEGFDDRLLDLLRRNEGPFISRPLYVLPVPHTWERVPGITLLGDAAHLMPPVGVGANLAMLDGAELAQAVIAHPTIDAALNAYESVMLPRSAEEAKAAADILAVLVPDTDSTEAFFPDDLTGS